MFAQLSVAPYGSQVPLVAIGAPVATKPKAARLSSPATTTGNTARSSPNGKPTSVLCSQVTPLSCESATCGCPSPLIQPRYIVFGLPEGRPMVFWPTPTEGS